MNQLFNAAPIQPRDYQAGAVDALFTYLDAMHGVDNANPVVVMPTGTGKSIVIAHFIFRMMQRFPNARFAKLVHVQELVEQNADKLQRIWPGAPLGIYSAGLRKRDTWQPIIFGTPKSVVNALDKIIPPDVLWIDECHLISPKEATTYQQIIAHWKKQKPWLRVVGSTATHYRLGQGLLTQQTLNEGEQRIFSDIVVDQSSPAWWSWFIAHGYLVPLVTRPTHTQLEVGSTSIANGDYVQSQLQRAVDHSELNRAVVAEMCQIAYDRRRWVVFCAGIEHAEHMADALNLVGAKAAALHSKLTKDERRERLTAHREGRLLALCTNNLLTTGHDDPEIDFIACCRPTVSVSLWVQMLGRGARPAPGKLNCLVGDFARNAAALGLVDAPRIPKPKGKGTGEAPVKICDCCGNYNHASARICIHCGAAFDIELKIKKEAGDAPVMSSHAVPEVVEMDVWRINYFKHTSKSGNVCVKVQYTTSDVKLFFEYLFFEGTIHPNALHKSREWWRQRVDANPPVDTDFALQRLSQGIAMMPKKIRVWCNKQYPEIVSYVFS